ncbi:fungal-specific transcription factor domain-containing protein [Tuber brumale]|nr:fungal-specific transcription factor domain-containing protein [Tuber brumale]
MEAKENNGSRKSPGASNKAERRRSSADGRRRINDDDRGTDASGRGSEGSNALKLYHTLTACTRCRSRKTRCDAGLPKCGPCERSGAHCEFFDSTKQKTIPRSYVVHLQNRVRDLEEQIRVREALFLEAEAPNSEELVRGVGLVNFADYEHYKEPRYVGSSSGVTVTRLVLEATKKNLDSQAFKDLTTQHRNTFRHALRTNPDPGDSYANLSSLPASRLPSREITDKLVELFCARALYQLPVLHEPTFVQDVADVYAGSGDPFKNFQLKMVLAISMQKLSKHYAGLADSYFLAGLQHMEDVLEAMDHRTLQCLLVMAQYALVTPTRMAVYHIVGIAVRLCIQLGYHQERTIMLSATPLDPVTKDMRRRWFWTSASMEYGLSHVLGRPSAFATADAFVDVRFYEPVDDVYITAGGILPGPVSVKKLISMHFFRMRRLQAEIRQTLYQNPREHPKNNSDPWFAQIHAKLDNWRASCPVDEHGGTMNPDWFDHRYHLMIIFTYRPSPQIPQPSAEAVSHCYNSAIKGIHLQKKMFEEKSIDFTWVYLHQIYTATITLIWTLYSSQIRGMHHREEVERNLGISLSLLARLAERWPGTEAAADLFDRLGQAALQSYSANSRHSTQTPPTGSHHSHAGSPPATRASFSPHSHSSPCTYESSSGSRSVEEMTPSPGTSGTSASHGASYSTGFRSTDYENEQNHSPPGPELPEAADLPSIFDPASMYVFPTNSIPGFLGSWDPTNPFFCGAADAQGIEALGTMDGQPIGIDAANVLNQQQQQNELLNILQDESLQRFDVTRQWIPDYESPQFY